MDRTWWPEPQGGFELCGPLGACEGRRPGLWRPAGWSGLGGIVLVALVVLIGPMGFLLRVSGRRATGC